MKYQILKDLIEINTIKDKDNQKIREYLKQTLLQLNFKITEIGEGNKKVLIAKRNESKIGFVCHTDTVNASNNWTYNPHTLTTKKNLMYGLGVSDMKGGIAALLEVLKEIDIDYPCAIYFTYDEEINFEGIKKLTGELNDFPETLIFPEPTNLTPMIANKGCIEFEVTCFGKSTHSSTPNKGDNAILKIISFIKDLTKYENIIKKEIDSIYEIPYATFNLGIINGGDAINKVLDKCKISFDFRTINNEQNAKIINEVTKICQKYNAKINIINNAPAARNNNSLFINKIEQICNNRCSSINYLTEASFFKNKNILILGPGPITAHQTDEFISIDSYLATIEIYKEIIKELNK